MADFSKLELGELVEMLIGKYPRLTLSQVEVLHYVAKHGDVSHEQMMQDLEISGDVLAEASASWMGENADMPPDCLCAIAAYAPDGKEEKFHFELTPAGRDFLIRLQREKPVERRLS